MISTFDLKTKYTPIKKVTNGYKISWDYKDFLNYEMEDSGEVDENNEPIMKPTGKTTPTDYCTFKYEIIFHKPSLNEIQNLILGYYDKETDKKILNGFKWKDMQVWLSSENQFNYKAAYDLAVQTQGATLPIVFKFGDSLNPIYYTFESLEDFSDFYTSAISYINTTLSNGWQKKDSIDQNQYQITD